MKTLLILILITYIFSCSGEHAANEGSATTDSSAVVIDTMKVDTVFIEEDVTLRP